MSTDKEVLEQHSSPGLKRNMLSRYGKKWHLMDTYKMSQEERTKVLDELYGPEVDPNAHHN